MSPRIPQYTRQVAPSGQGANVRANPAALTQGEAAAVGFGNAMTQEGAYFATKMREAREVSELSSAKVRMLQEFNDLDLELANDPDYTTYADRFTKRAGEIRKNASGHITEQNALNAFDSAFDVESEQRRFGIQKLANKKEIGKMTADLNFNVDAAVKAGNYPMIQEMLRGATLAGIITPEKAEAIRQNSEHKITYEGAWNAALESPTYEEALEVINKREGLTPSERDALGGHVKRVFDQKEAQGKKVIEAAQEDWRNKALPELKQGKLTFAGIMAAPIDAKEKEHWNGLIEKQNKAIIDGQKDPLTVTDFTTYATLSEKCNTAPETITDQEIYSYVGKGETGGISTTDAEKLVGIRKARLSKDKPDDPLKTERANRYQGMLKSLKGANVFSGDEVENETIYGQKANLLDSYLLANPEATDKEVEDYFGTLTVEEKANWVKNLLNTFLEPFTKEMPELHSLAFGGEPSGEEEIGEAVAADGKDSRPDGTPKSEEGWLGKLKMTDGTGRYMTEYSIGVQIGGKETLIPSIVPTLSQDEIDYLRSGKGMTDEIVKKATDYAKERIKGGKSPFTDKQEDAAIKILREGKKPITEKNIKFVMEKLNAGD